MGTPAFIHLPVKDVDRSVAFFTKLGYSFNPELSGEDAGCMIVNELLNVMLLPEKFFNTFTEKTICDTAKSAEMIITVSAASREAVYEMGRNVIKAGGILPTPKLDTGWMYSQGFQDLDGHLWDVLYMDVEAVPENAHVAKLQWELRRTI
jgi:predicted lactoylglutathione lyase